MDRDHRALPRAAKPPVLLRASAALVPRDCGLSLLQPTPEASYPELPFVLPEEQQSPSPRSRLRPRTPAPPRLPRPAELKLSYAGQSGTPRHGWLIPPAELHKSRRCLGFLAAGISAPPRLPLASSRRCRCAAALSAPARSIASSASRPPLLLPPLRRGPASPASFPPPGRRASARTPSPACRSPRVASRCPYLQVPPRRASASCEQRRNEQQQQLPRRCVDRASLDQEASIAPGPARAPGRPSAPASPSPPAGPAPLPAPLLQPAHEACFGFVPEL